jgi:hypothetical protein
MASPTPSRSFVAESDLDTAATARQCGRRRSGGAPPASGSRTSINGSALELCHSNGRSFAAAGLA